MWTLWGGSQPAPSPSDDPVWRDLNPTDLYLSAGVSAITMGFPFSSHKGNTAGMDGISLQIRMFLQRQRELLKSTSCSYVANTPPYVPFLLFLPTSLPRQTKNLLHWVPKDKLLLHTSRKESCSQCAALGEQESPAPDWTLLARSSWHFDGQFCSLLNPSFSPGRSLVISSLLSGGGMGALGTFRCVPWDTCSLHTSHLLMLGNKQKFFCVMHKTLLLPLPICIKRK